MRGLIDPGTARTKEARAGRQRKGRRKAEKKQGKGKKKQRKQIERFRFRIWRFDSRRFAGQWTIWWMMEDPLLIGNAVVGLETAGPGEVVHFLGTHPQMVPAISGAVPNQITSHRPFWHLTSAGTDDY
jgi:hypothetical protein